jgi:hypothetical protein
MANGKNAVQRNGKEWWSRRPFAGVSVGGRYMKSWKRLLHKVERKRAKIEIFETETE